MRGIPAKCLAIGFATILMLTAVSSAEAATIRVTTTADRYDAAATAGCSLREAITATVTGTGFAGCPASTEDHEIHLPDGTYRITRPGTEDANEAGDLDVTAPGGTLIRPEKESDRVVIDADGIDRVFDGSGSAGLMLVDLTVRGGRPSTDDGGGIRASNLSLDGVTITGNETRFDGGGLAVYGNFAATNSTISGNTARGSGGGIYLPGGSASGMKALTITGNTADSDANGNGDGGGISAFGAAAVFLTNTINAANVDLSPLPADRVPDCLSDMSMVAKGVLSTQEIGTGACQSAGPEPSNILVSDPHLLPLGMNGGPTPTHPLKPESAAIDAGFPAECATVDQRRLNRPEGSCDIGAFELTRTVADGGTAVLDGLKLTLAVTCPKRFKPRCRMALAPVARRKKGVAMAKGKRIAVRSGRSRKVTFNIKPRFRARLEAIIYRTDQRLLLRQKIRSKRIRGKRNRRIRTLFTKYRVGLPG